MKTTTVSGERIMFSTRLTTGACGKYTHKNNIMHTVKCMLMVYKEYIDQCGNKHAILPHE